MMITTINWGQLYQQGRCKAVGVSWTDEELKAVVSGVPAEYVRLGFLTMEEYEAKKAKVEASKDPLLLKSKEELLVLAHQKGIPATSAADKETLAKLLGEGSVEVKEPKQPKPEVVEEVIPDGTVLGKRKKK